MDDLNSLFAAKEVRRRQLAALTFPEKIRVLIHLQTMAAPILRSRGRNVQPWRPS